MTKNSGRAILLAYVAGRGERKSSRTKDNEMRVIPEVPRSLQPGEGSRVYKQTLAQRPEFPAYSSGV